MLRVYPQAPSDTRLVANPDALTIATGSVDFRMNVLSNDYTSGPEYGYPWYSRSDLQVVEALSPQHGGVRFDDDGKAVLYTPDEGFLGGDRFRYTVRDGEGREAVAEVFVNVVNPIAAVEDWFLIDAGSETNALDVLKNDRANAVAGILPQTVTYYSLAPSLTEYQSLHVRTIDSVSAGSAGGTIEIGEDGGKLFYTPAEGFEGLETFTYTIRDDSGHTSSATVRLRVTPPDQPIETSSDAWREAVEQMFLERALDQSSHLFGTIDVNSLDQEQIPWYYNYFYPREYVLWDWDVQAMPALVTGTLRTSSTAEGQGAEFVMAAGESFSTTNVQVAGVDEADIVKTDGDFLYVVSNVGGESPLHEVVIVDVRDATNPTVVSRVAFAGEVLGQYLHGDRLVVVSRASDGSFDPETDSSAATVRVTVLNLGDRLQPTIASETALEGALVDTRSVGDQLYLVTESRAILSLPELPRPITTCADADTGCFYETVTQYIERVRDDIAALAADFEISAGRFASYNAHGELIDSGQNVDGFALPTGDLGHWASYQQRLTAVFSIDVEADAPQVESSTSIVTSENTQLYASADSIYLYGTSWGSSTIYKFDLDAEQGVEWAASGRIGGQISNSFALDEHEGYLRVATHVGNTNQVLVLAQEGIELNVAGQIDNLAPGELLYSVRFMGDRGFLVTFRKVDPLFVLDLSDPLEPRVAGELKVPGYSNYLQLIDENTLLGIGRNADERTGLFQGLQASLFDLTELDNPTLIDRYTFEGGRNTWTPAAESARALSDHHAISYFGAQQILALPIYSTQNWPLNYAGVDNTPIFDDPDQSAVRVLHVDRELGFEVLGQVEFETRATRTVRVGDVLYSIAPDVIKANELLQPENNLGEVVIQDDYEPFFNPIAIDAGIRLMPMPLVRPILVALNEPTLTAIESPGSTSGQQPNENDDAASAAGTTATTTNANTETSAMAMYDLDGDGIVGFGDLALFSGQFLRRAPGGEGGMTADFDGSGGVDFGDLSLFGGVFQRRVAPSNSANVGNAANAADSIFTQIGLEDLQRDESN
ncbi:MAG: beta-propeller domain-containing protein [Planctomycetales bacterium]|nr:beta-propeller domain-containing protein [Planctomycetales bacterium]